MPILRSGILFHSFTQSSSSSVLFSGGRGADGGGADRLPNALLLGLEPRTAARGGPGTRGGPLRRAALLQRNPPANHREAMINYEVYTKIRLYYQE